MGSGAAERPGGGSQGRRRPWAGVWGPAAPSNGPSHKSNVFLHLEFDQTQTYRDYDLSSPWIVHGCWEDEWIDDELGRRILIYRNTKAHENPDHELWRLAEYEGDYTQIIDRPEV